MNPTRRVRFADIVLRDYFSIDTLAVCRVALHSWSLYQKKMKKQRLLIKLYMLDKDKDYLGIRHVTNIVGNFLIPNPTDGYTTEHFMTQYDIQFWHMRKYYAVLFQLKELCNEVMDRDDIPIHMSLYEHRGILFDNLYNHMGEGIVIRRRAA